VSFGSRSFDARSAMFLGNQTIDDSFAECQPQGGQGVANRVALMVGGELVDELLDTLAPPRLCVAMHIFKVDLPRGSTRERVLVRVWGPPSRDSGRTRDTALPACRLRELAQLYTRDLAARLLMTADYPGSQKQLAYHRLVTAELPLASI